MSIMSTLAPLLLQGVMGGVKGAMGTPDSTPGKNQENTNTPMIPVEGAAKGAANSIFDNAGPVLSQMFGKSAKQKGEDIRKTNEAAYPGTNPWEQLGGSGGGTATTVASQQIKNQKEMQSRELKTRVDVANIQANTARDVASTGARAPNRQADFVQKRLPLELEQLNHRQKLTFNQIITEAHKAKLTGQNARYARMKANIAPEMLRAGVTAQEAKNLKVLALNAIGNPKMLKRLLKGVTTTATDLSKVSFKATPHLQKSKKGNFQTSAYMAGIRSRQKKQFKKQ